MASTGEVWKLGHRPALDGVRGIAVLLVLATHSTELFANPVPHMGGVGVTMFFTLSGFLITSLLLEERAREGRIGLGGFYLRRARRLLPALVAMLVVVIALGVVQWRAVAAVLLYVGNWYGAAGYPLPWLKHTWSLAVEEQFYLAWPLVAVGVRSRRILFVVTLAGVVGSVAARVLLWDGTAETAFRISWWTHTRADALLIGCLLALAMCGSPARRVPSVLVWPPLAAVVALGVLGDDWWVVAGMPLAVALVTAALIWVLVQSPSARWLSSGALAWVGRRSYGLYLWHVSVLGVSLAFGLTGWAYAIVGVAGSLAVAALSWRFIESPFLRSCRPLVVADAAAGSLPGLRGRIVPTRADT